jgi:TIR domain
MDFNVFVSYSTKDLDHVDALRSQLADTPLKLFVAEHSVIPGEDLTQKIKASISNCDLFVFVWSKNAKESGWVSQEIGHASALNKRMLPLVLDQEHIPEGFVSNLKYIQAYKSISDALLEARNILIDAYEKKKWLEIQQQQNESNNRFGLGVAAFLLWIALKK